MIFYLYVHFTEFKTRVTRGAGTAFPSGAPVLVGSVLLDHYVMRKNKIPIGITSVVSLTCNGKSKKLSTPISKISEQVNLHCS
jgi:hypothetical protein